MSKIMKIASTVVACGFLACAITATAATTGFREAHYFSSNSMSSGSAITNGWDGWSVVNGSGGTSVFTNVTFHIGVPVYTNRIVAGMKNSTLSHDFTNALDQFGQRTNIWVSMRISPVLNDTVPTSGEITAAAVVFWFGSDSNVYFYNSGVLQSNGFAGVVTNGAWYDVTAHLDYNTHTYDLFVNSTNDSDRTVSGKSFYSSARSAFTNVTVTEKSTTSFSYLDFAGAATSTNTALAAQIFMRAYMTAEGVVIEFTTIQEQAAGVEMSVYRADGSLVGTVISQGNNGSYTYRLIDSLAGAGGSYNYSVVDDEGIMREAQVTVGDELSALVEMTATSIKLNWKSQPGLMYDIYKAVLLSDGFVKVNAEPILASDYTTTYDVPLDNGETRAFFKIRALSPNP